MTRVESQKAVDLADISLWLTNPNGKFLEIQIFSGTRVGMVHMMVWVRKTLHFWGKQMIQKQKQMIQWKMQFANVSVKQDSPTCTINETRWAQRAATISIAWNTFFILPFDESAQIKPYVAAWLIWMVFFHQKCNWHKCIVYSWRTFTTHALSRVLGRQ